MVFRKAEDVVSSDKSLAGIALISAHQGDHDKAFAFHAQALGLNPENMVALFGLVQAAHMLGRTAEAIAPLTEYLNLNPDKHEVRFALSGCLIASGRQADARRHLETILEQDPANVQSAELLSQL